MNNQQGQQERRRAPVEGQERSRVLLGQELAEVGSRLHSDRALVVEVVERSLLLVVGGSLDQALVVGEHNQLQLDQDRQAGQDSNHEEGSDSLPQGEEGLAEAEEGPLRYSV